MSNSEINSSVSTKPTVAGVDRHKNLSQKELLHEYVIPGKPVILTEAASSWPAMKKWTPDFFKTKYGHLSRDTNKGKIKLGDYMELMFHSTDENPAPYPYNYDILHYFPELMNDIDPPIRYGKMDRISHPLLPKSILQRTHAHELHIGGRGGSFRLHYDEMFLHTQQTQIMGDKEYYLFAPDQGEFLYPEEENPKMSKLKHVFKVDLDKFPLYKKAQQVFTTCYEGETLFMPMRWWHTTRITKPSITYGRGHLNTYNWNNFLKDYYIFWSKKQPVRSRLLYSYCKMLGTVMNIQESLL